MIDTFRKEYRQLSDDEKAYISKFKEQAEILYTQFEDAIFLDPDPRMMALAKTNLEQSIMWAIKAIT